MSVTASTTLETFFVALVTRIRTQMPGSWSLNRVFVVDKLRLQSPATPCIQVEPTSLQVIGEQTGMNAMMLEYKVHAVVRVELDQGKRETERLVGDAPTVGALARGSLAMAFQAAETLRGWVMSGNSSDAQVLMRVEGGAHDDVEGLASAYAQFRTMIRVASDG